MGDGYATLCKNWNCWLSSKKRTLANVGLDFHSKSVWVRGLAQMNCMLVIANHGGCSANYGTRQVLESRLDVVATDDHYFRHWCLGHRYLTRQFAFSLSFAKLKRTRKSSPRVGA